MPSNSSPKAEPTVNDGAGNAVQRGDTIRYVGEVLAVHPNTARGDLIKVAGINGTKMLIAAAAAELVAEVGDEDDE